MGSKVLRIQMLGGSSKSGRLLQMLLLSLKKGISKSELIDNLYGWNEKQDMVNGNKNLNNLIYRLKKQLITLSRSSDSSAVLWFRSENYNSASCKVICICFPFWIFHVVSERTVLHIISVFFG